MITYTNETPSAWVALIRESRQAHKRSRLVNPQADSSGYLLHRHVRRPSLRGHAHLGAQDITQWLIELKHLESVRM